MRPRSSVCPSPLPALIPPPPLLFPFVRTPDLPPLFRHYPMSSAAAAYQPSRHLPAVFGWLAVSPTATAATCVADLSGLCLGSISSMDLATAAQVAQRVVVSPTPETLSISVITYSSDAAQILPYPPRYGMYWPLSQPPCSIQSQVCVGIERKLFTMGWDFGIQLCVGEGGFKEGQFLSWVRPDVAMLCGLPRRC